jgi:hypothetical protein
MGLCLGMDLPVGFDRVANNLQKQRLDLTDAVIRP